MDKYNKIVTKKVNKNACIAIVLFFAYFFVQMIFINVFVFGSDEEDIMLGGKAIARGYFLYKDFLSQHMPISYYISAIFELVGAHSLYQQRVCYYLLFSLLWVLIYLNYRDENNKIALICYPFILLSIASTYELGNTIISEHLAGVGFVILVLEYRIFTLFRNLRYRDYFLISLALLLTIGTIFIAVFGVAVICVGVFLKEIRNIIKNSIQDNWIKPESIGVFKLLMIVGAPWIVLLIYYKITKCIHLFYYSAYEINRTIYPKYIGFGDSVFQTIISSPGSFYNYCTQGIVPTETISIYSIAQIILVLLMIAFITYVGKSKSKLDMSIYLILLFFTGGIRGIFNYHGTFCVEIISLFVAIFIEEDILECIKKRDGIIYTFLLVMTLIWLEAPLATKVGNLGRVDMTVASNTETEIIQEITQPNEAIWNCAMWNDLFMMADRVGLYNIAGTPWGYKAWRKSVMKDFGDNPPRILVLDRSIETWGYSLKDYGKKMLKYVDEHYDPIYGELIYVRKDMWDTLPDDPRLNKKP